MCHKSVQEVSNRCVTRVSRRSVTGASYVQEVSNRCVTRVSRRSVTGAESGYSKIILLLNFCLIGHSI